MNGQVIARLIVVVILGVTANGCANQEKKRISMLEEANKNLTERLNLTSSDLDAARRNLDVARSGRDEVERRLQDTFSQAEELRRQLAERPTPEETAPGWTAVPGGAMIAIEGSVLFAPGKVTLRREARRALDAIISTVEGQYADKDILVFGHTDNRPIKKSGWADNYQLSTERALAVVRYLKDHGVSPNRLIAGGSGEYRPRAPNISEANRTANRRVEFFAMEPITRSAQP